MNISSSWMFPAISNEGFPDSSVGEESTCNAGDPGSISGWGRYPGEGIDYPLQYSWASLVAQLVKNTPAVWETWVWFLDWEDPLEEGVATHSIWSGDSHGQRSLASYSPWGHKDLDMIEQLSTAQHRMLCYWVFYDHSTTVRHLGVRSQADLRKHHYEQS